jgi:hypothetical protein
MQHIEQPIRRPIEILTSAAAAAALSVAMLPAGAVASEGGSAGMGTDQSETAAAEQSARTAERGQAGTMSDAGGEAGGKPMTKRLPDRYKLSNWMGKTVQNADGEELGTVSELIMDDLGRVRYVIMESKLLADEKQGDVVAVPIGHFMYPLTRKQHLVFDATPGQVQQAPSFGAADTPDMGRTEISRVIIAYWLPEGSGDGKSGTEQRGAAAERAGEQSAQSDYDPNRDMINLSERKSELFEKLDKNDDAAIDRQEAGGHERLSERFDEADTYGNEAITRAEFAAFELTENGNETSVKDSASDDRGGMQGAGSGDPQAPTTNMQ